MNKVLINYQSGFLFLKKPQNITSNDFLKDVKHKFNFAKLGHAGTLDKLASGAMIICINKATKLQNLFLNADKVYIFNVLFNTKTDTGDLDGKVILKNNIFINDDLLNEIINLFSNKSYMQMPPEYSALKYKGKKLSDYARENNISNIKILPRQVKIYDLKLIQKIDSNQYQFKAIVSKGAYIRSLANDIAEKLSTVAVCTMIERIGYQNILNKKFLTNDFKNLDDCTINDLIPINQLFNFPKYLLSDEEYVKVKNHNVIKIINAKSKYYFLEKNNQIIYLYVQFKDNEYKPFCLCA